MCTVFDPATRLVSKFVDFSAAVDLAFTSPSAFVAFNDSHFEPYVRRGDTPSAAAAPTTLRCPVQGCKALNAKVATEDMQHEVYSPGARPDVRIRVRTRKYKLLEVKVLCPISSNPASTGHAGTYAAFANTAPAKREEVAAKYAPAKTNGHATIPCVFEVFGGAAPEVVSLLGEWGRAARSKTPPGEEPPWPARNYMPYIFIYSGRTQLLCKEAQRGAAIEILNRVDGEVADRDAARLRTVSG